jgi:cytochrome c
MNRWQWTQAGAAVSAAILVAGGSYWFAGQVMKPPYPEARAYTVEGVPPVDLAGLQRSWPSGLRRPGEPTELRGYMGSIEKAVLPIGAGTGPVAPAAPADLGTLLAAADPARGKGTAGVCGSCHTFDPGGANRVGPNLWAVVGRPVGSHSGFAYSPAVAGHGGAWDYAALDHYLAAPAKAIPGNKMAFNGIRNPRDRANLLAYLGTLNATPAPYPPPQAAGGAPSVTR